MKAKRRRHTCCLALLLVAALAPPAQAGTGGVLQLPFPPKPSARGLQLAVDTAWVQGYGYRPVRCEVTSVAPSQADRTLSVEFGLCGWPTDEEVVTVAADIEIPAGSKTVAHTLAVPQLDDAQRFNLRVWEDGSEIDALSVKGQPLDNSGYVGWATGGPRILFVADGPVDVSQFLLVVPDTNAGTTLGTSVDVPWFQSRPAAELEESWILYSGLDLAFLSLADARDLAASRPAAWEALRAWAHTGGNLCLFGAGDDWHGLEEIEQLLACPASDQLAPAKYRGWEAPSTMLFKSKVAPAIRQAGGIPTVPANSQAPPFVWKPAGLGCAIALADDQPFPGDMANWRWIVESLGPGRIDWCIRHGTAPDRSNPQFNDFLIADVGLPPIRAYQVLITLFVVVIGPVNYWILKRNGRLHLFLFTVPAAAVVTAVGLLAYALVADGLSTRLRARSLTRLDQRSGEAVRLARLSYYTGLAPTDGLDFPDDTTLVPMLLSANDDLWHVTNRRVVWRDGQRLTRGWIRSRMPTQFVTTRADKTSHELAITKADDGLTVENHLGCAVRQLMLCDQSGGLHYGTGIDADGQQTLDALDNDDAITAAVVDLASAMARDRPELPADMIVGQSRGIFSVRSQPHVTAVNSAVYTTASLLEVELERLASDLSTRSLKPGSYVAIVERPPEIAVGTDAVHETQSLHVIEGSW